MSENATSAGTARISAEAQAARTRLIEIRDSIDVVGARLQLWESAVEPLKDLHPILTLDEGTVAAKNAAVDAQVQVMTAFEDFVRTFRAAQPGGRQTLVRDIVNAVASLCGHIAWSTSLWLTSVGQGLADGLRSVDDDAGRQTVKSVVHTIADDMSQSLGLLVQVCRQFAGLSPAKIDVDAVTQFRVLLTQQATSLLSLLDRAPVRTAAPDTSTDDSMMSA
jgi:hypothetical protein